MQSAVAKVFSIVELTEAILSAGVDMKQLFVLQRVNRHIRDTIIGSKRLTTKLFLRHEFQAGVNGDAVRVNPLILEDFLADHRVDPRISVCTLYALDYYFNRPRFVRLHVLIACQPGAEFETFTEALDKFVDGPRGLLERATALNRPLRIILEVKFVDVCGGLWCTGQSVIEDGRLDHVMHLIRVDCRKWAAWTMKGGMVSTLYRQARPWP